MLFLILSNVSPTHFLFALFQLGTVISPCRRQTNGIPANPPPPSLSLSTVTLNGLVCIRLRPTPPEKHSHSLSPTLFPSTSRDLLLCTSFTGEKIPDNLLSSKVWYSAKVKKNNSRYLNCADKSSKEGGGRGATDLFLRCTDKETSSNKEPFLCFPFRGV